MSHAHVKEGFSVLLSKLLMDLSPKMASYGLNHWPGGVNRPIFDGLDCGLVMMPSISKCLWWPWWLGKYWRINWAINDGRSSCFIYGFLHQRPSLRARKCINVLDDRFFLYRLFLNVLIDIVFFKRFFYSRPISFFFKRFFRSIIKRLKINDIPKNVYF